MFNSKLKKDLAEIRQEKKEVTAMLEEQSANIEEITATIQEINANTQEVNNKVGKSKESNLKNIELINHLDNSATKLDDNIRKLAEHGNRINAITRTINTIASKTNILALNASIEAAKAGEFGTGFSVIAKEVDNLSKNTQSNSVEIETLIAEILATIEVLKEEVSDVVAGVTQFKKDTDARMEHINDIFAETREIGIATEQLAQVSQVQANELQNIISKKLKA